MTHPPDELAGIQKLQARTALRKKLETLLRGSGLEIRELASNLAICNPGDPDKGRIYVSYASGDVSHKRTLWSYLGPLEGYEPNDDPDREPAVDAATIITTLTEQGPPPRPVTLLPREGDTMSSEYWVYEDTVTHEAVLHRGDCPYCNQGMGRGKGRDERVNWWRPFASVAEARSASLEPGTNPVRNCGRCMT